MTATPSPDPSGTDSTDPTPLETAAPVDATHVSDDALATLIGLAAHEVPGVVGMAPAGFGDGIRRILGVRQADEGVEIDREHEDDAPDVVLHVVVAYGVNIPVVAESVEERVRYASEHYGGVEVADVTVRVAGVSRD
ncbi:MAG: Asp23/Gls24 family envelope stress response protein [Trueperaceae bacterium]|nr:Asp23/Gls24 family envelope stress response protein [Trueperaceae bacterium]